MLQTTACKKKQNLTQKQWLRKEDKKQLTLEVRSIR